MAYCFVCNQAHPLFGKCPNQVMPTWKPSGPLVMSSSNSTRSGRTSTARHKMHSNLSKFLDEVWTRRGSIKSHSAIYSLYNQLNPGQANPFSHPEGKELIKYLKALQQIENETESTVSTQGYEDFTFTELMKAIDTVQAGGTLPVLLNKHVRKDLNIGDDENDGEVARAFLNDVMATFFHFLKYKREDCTQRVYLNVKGDHAIKVMKFVTISLVAGLDGVDEAKVAGPRGVGERADSIVIYCDLKYTVKTVIERLTEYQRLPGNQNAFGPEVPKMTEPVQGLVGVAVGAEPNLTKVAADTRTKLGRQESFGGMRAKLIWYSLNNTSPPTDKEDFFNYVLTIFGKAGLNPMAPYI